MLLEGYYFFLSIINIDYIIWLVKWLIIAIYYFIYFRHTASQEFIEDLLNLMKNQPVTKIHWSSEQTLWKHFSDSQTKLQKDLSKLEKSLTQKSLIFNCFRIACCMCGFSSFCFRMKVLYFFRSKIVHQQSTLVWTYLQNLKNLEIKNARKYNKEKNRF